MTVHRIGWRWRLLVETEVAVVAKGWNYYWGEERPFPVGEKDKDVEPIFGSPFVWYVNLAQVPRDRRFLVRMSHGEVTLAEASEGRVRLLDPTRRYVPHEKVAAWMEMPC